jgi:hypothetical protein
MSFPFIPSLLLLPPLCILISPLPSSSPLLSSHPYSLLSHSSRLLNFPSSFSYTLLLIPSPPLFLSEPPHDLIKILTATLHMPLTSSHVKPSYSNLHEPYLPFNLIFLSLHLSSPFINLLLFEKKFHIILSHTGTLFDVLQVMVS